MTPEEMREFVQSNRKLRFGAGSAVWLGGTSVEEPALQLSREPDSVGRREPAQGWMLVILPAFGRQLHCLC